MAISSDGSLSLPKARVTNSRDGVESAGVQMPPPAPIYTYMSFVIESIRATIPSSPAFISPRNSPASSSGSMKEVFVPGNE